MADLVLGDGYPFPYPPGISEEEQDRIAGDMDVEALRLHGVVSVEWRFTITVAFDSIETFEAARTATGWDRWGDHALTLEAQTSVPDGRDLHAAIIVGDKAYCRLSVEAAGGASDG